MASRSLTMFSSESSVISIPSVPFEIPFKLMFRFISRAGSSSLDFPKWLETPYYHIDRLEKIVNISIIYKNSKNVRNVNSDFNFLNLTCFNNFPCLGNAFVFTWIAGVAATWFDVTNTLSSKLLDILCFYSRVFSISFEYSNMHKINNILQG